MFSQGWTRRAKPFMLARIQVSLLWGGGVGHLASGTTRDWQPNSHGERCRFQLQKTNPPEGPDGRLGPGVNDGSTRVRRCSDHCQNESHRGRVQYRQREHRHWIETDCQRDANQATDEDRSGDWGRGAKSYGHEDHCKRQWGRQNERRGLIALIIRKL